MAFCSSCGSKTVDGAKFCQKCGCAVSETTNGINAKRQQEFAGKIYKCPGCGEVLTSFATNCPSCGLELRGIKATSAVREFALKLEAIESRRERGKPVGIFTNAAGKQHVSKTDEQKVSLIKNFAIPNTKEDMMEFMILATSNIDVSNFGKDDSSTIKKDKAIAEAWLSKIKQVYEKAKVSDGSSSDFVQIKQLYDDCMYDVVKQKKKRNIKMALLFGFLPLLLILEIIFIPMSVRNTNAKEETRLKAIVEEIDTTLNAGEYKYALLNTMSIEYGGSDDERERYWLIQKEYWIDKVIEEAAENDVTLERPIENVTDNSTSEASPNGFVAGFNDAFKEARDDIDKFNEIMNGTKGE